jgi:hypothetical protein
MLITGIGKLFVIAIADDAIRKTINRIDEERRLKLIPAVYL